MTRSNFMNIDGTKASNVILRPNLDTKVEGQGHHANSRPADQSTHICYAQVRYPDFSAKMALVAWDTAHVITDRNDIYLNLNLFKLRPLVFSVEVSVARCCLTR